MFRYPGPAPRRLLALLCLLLVMTGAAGSTDAQAPLDRRQAVSQINDLMRQDRRAEALPLCRAYTAAYPDDAAMLYNLACLENTVGDEARAEPAYEAALAAGFSDFELAAADPDLQGSLHSVVVAHNEAELARLAQLADRQALTLEMNTWSEPRELIVHGPRPLADPDRDLPRLRLRWQETFLELELTADRHWADAIAAANRAPWNGGPGLFLSLSVPDGSSDLESANHFLFAFGIEPKGNVGAMFVTSQGHWQLVSELTPKLKNETDDRLRLTATIPWQALMPYNPVVDTPLGLNATLVIPSGPERRRASLVETTDTTNPLARHRRFARLDFQTDSIDTDLFVGRLDDSLSRDHPLELDLVAVSTTAGEAVLSLNFMDQAGRSVLPQGPIKGRITLQKGTNHFTRQADFGSLQAGGYLLQAELVFPSGRSQTWGATVLHLPAGWQDRFEESATMVAQPEQATVRYVLDTITAAVANHRQRRNPGAIVASLMDLDQMLADAAETGTILPAKGSFVLVYPGPRGENRLCRIYLPAGREHVDGVNPILVLEHGVGHEARLAARIGRNYEFGNRKPTLKTGNDDRFPIYLVPELRPQTAGLPADLLAEAEACRRWALAYFQTPGVSLVGVDELGGTVLQMMERAPRELRGLLIFAGGGLNPWPLAQPDFLRRQLGPPPADLPLTWIDFVMETDDAGQAPAILQALQDLGYQVDASRKVRGSLSLTQVADRVVLWAEDLR